MEAVKDVLGKWGKKAAEATKKAEDLAGNMWQHCMLFSTLFSPSFLILTYVRTYVRMYVFDCLCFCLVKFIC